MREEQTVFRDYPLTFWLMGMLSIVAGAFMRETAVVREVFIVLGIVAAGFAPVLTVTCDRRRQELELGYWALFRRSVKSYEWSEICSIGVKEDTGEGNFRVQLFLTSGEVVPLRQWYSPGKARHARLARKLESSLGSAKQESSRVRGGWLPLRRCEGGRHLQLTRSVRGTTRQADQCASSSPS